MNNTTYFDSSLAVPELPLLVKASFIFYLVVIHLIGVPGNIIVATVYGRTSPKSACDWLIFIMSITDCVVCFCTPLLYLRAELHISLPWKSNVVACFQNWLQFSAMIASCLILVVIAVDRYIKICHFCVVSLTPTRARNLGVLCVFISTIVCVFPFARQGQTIGCLIQGVKPPESVRRYALIMFCGFTVCFVIVIFAYANICKQISDKTTRRQHLKNGNSLRTPNSDTYSTTKKHMKRWWRRPFLKHRGETIHILDDPKESDEYDCHTHLNNQRLGKFTDGNLLGLARNCDQCLPTKIAFDLRNCQLKKCASCPHLNINGSDKTISDTICLGKFPRYASSSEIFDGHAKEHAIITTQYRSEFAIRSIDNTKYREQKVILNNNKPLSFPFPVSHRFSIQESIESCKCGFSGKFEYAMKYGNRSRHNGHVPAVCGDLFDVFVDGNTLEYFNTKTIVANPPSVTHSSNKKCINRGFDEATGDHHFKNMYDIDRNRYCCHDNISETMLGCPCDVTSGLGNHFGLGLPNGDVANVNEQTGYNIIQSQTQSYSPPENDVLTAPFIPKENQNGQRSVSALEKTRQVLATPGKSQMLQLNVINRKEGDEVSTDLSSAHSSSRCRKQIDESQPPNLISTKCEVKILASGSRCNRERQMTLMLASVTATFLLSWLPPWLFHILWYYGPIDNSQSFVVWYISKIYLIIYAANPLIYYNFNESFRSKVRHLLRQVFKFCHYRRA